jgi:plastocyanin
VTASSLPRRAALLVLGQLGLALVGAACAPGVAPPNPTTGIQPTAHPSASGASAQPTTVSGAAPLPLPPPTPGGPPSTIVGVSSTPATVVATPSSLSQAAAAMVTMTADHRFEPAQVNISRGQTVAWRNVSRNPQTVTGDPSLVSDPRHVLLPDGVKPFDSGVINTNSIYSHTFDTIGNYQYASLPFESQNMLGTISVQDQE